ncbi:hypothetical protein NIES4075_66990 [Tolypothrix sp. NIES-4075]|uniref:hypothetical protein n=1 Tax=Tolypothrix sp. NIES-4075 TaxID=2005459 RepID=UPI000B5CB045|nr:hypothetical protein [Tolypothrix sp. NIES-4075]GAX45678.1 hypothetical protein NIES4075_66990 [Tolypothrix sp. NIES-4075]
MQSGFTGDDDEQAILEILERSYNFELSNIFGTGGVKVKDLNSDFHGEEWDRLQNFYERRFRGGMDALLKGKIEPQGLPVSLGTSLSGVTNILMLEELPGAKPEWNVPCLLGILCPLDKVVVDQLPNLKVQKADKVTEVYWVFDGKTWVMKTRERGAFSDANQGVIGLKTQADCPTAAEYIIHEVRHQNQPADLKIPQTEIDAYTFEEEWAIKRGLPGTPDFRTQKPGTQEEIPNSPQIEAYVRKRYSGITSTPGDSLIGHTPTNEAKVRKPNGSEYTRPAQQGEEHQDYEKTKANLNNLPKVNSSEWVCPKTKTTP